jgi:LPXTG-motif cell wall-anchored protein
MPEEPVVYAIYEIKGYELTITKTVIGDANGKSEFTFNVHSDQLLNNNYFISVTDKNGDTQVSTISAVNQTVTVEVENGGSATIYGLQSGIYTLTEADTENCEVKATVNGVEAAVKNDTLGIAINDDTSVDVVNNYPIPVTGADDNASPYIAVIAVITMVAAVFWIKRRKEEMFNENASL